MDGLGAAGHLDSALTVPVPAHELRDLQRKLHSQPTIEQAKGIVMSYYGVAAVTALDILRGWAQQANIKLPVLTEALVALVAERRGSGPVEPAELFHRIVIDMIEDHPAPSHPKTTGRSDLKRNHQPDEVPSQGHDRGD